MNHFLLFGAIAQLLSGVVRSQLQKCLNRAIKTTRKKIDKTETVPGLYREKIGLAPFA